MTRPEPGRFDEFVAAELPRLVGLARGLSRSEYDAWDLVQETLARIGTRWSRLDPQRHVAAYSRTILIRLNIDRLRRLRRELPTSLIADRAVDDVIRTGPEPWLADAMRQLSPRQRTAVVLRYGLDLDLADIAAHMGCSAGTTRSHLSRGLERLRRLAPLSSSTHTGREPDGHQ